MDRPDYFINEDMSIKEARKRVKDILKRIKEEENRKNIREEDKREIPFIDEDMSTDEFFKWVKEELWRIKKEEKNEDESEK